MQKSSLAIVAVEKNSFVGTACLKENDMETRKDLSPWLAGVYVKENFRKNGIAKKLIFKLQKIAEKMGILQLYLYTPNAEKFYESIGWEILGKTVYNGTEVYIMRLNLKQPIKRH